MNEEIEEGQELFIQATSVLKRTQGAEQEGYKIIIHEGGSRSSKTWSIFQFFILKAYYGENITLTIVRDKLSWIKATLLKDFEQMVDKYGFPVYPEVNVNRAEQVYNINGSEFAFFGLDYAQKLHGRTQDWFWVNEVMEVGQKSFDQLEMRTKVGGVIDYNPSDDLHWIFNLQKRPDVKVIKSTMLDNPFLEQTIINKIKSYEPTPENKKRGTADEYMWQVYGLGIKARLQGAIFTNFDIIEQIPDKAEHRGYWLDFGYTNDPTSIGSLYMMDNELFIKELVYETGLTNDDISNKLESLGIEKNELIVADSSEPKSIEELRRKNWRVIPSVKGSDSINYGIDLLKAYKIHITRDSINTENEFRKYKWAEDKTGKALNKPIDSFNHSIDGLRYLASEVIGKARDFSFISNY